MSEIVSSVNFMSTSEVTDNPIYDTLLDAFLGVHGD